MEKRRTWNQELFLQVVTKPWRDSYRSLLSSVPGMTNGRGEEGI